MATLTQVKRDNNTARYLRKDARNQIYSAIYGKQEHTYLYRKLRSIKRNNNPAQDETRRMSVFFDWPSAKAIVDTFIDNAQFSAVQREEVLVRLKALKNYKPN